MTAPSIREALKPCPFCGSDRISAAYQRDGRVIGCAGCGARVGAFQPGAEEKATEKWNTRTTPAPPQDVVEGIAQPDQSKIGMLLLDYANGFGCDDIDFARTAGARLINSAAETAKTPPDLLDDLIARFSVALLEKLKAAREKYGFSREHWRDTDWMESCQRSLVEHLAKGDPRDVAAYCAFMWHHGWKTAAHPDEAAIRADEREKCAKVAGRDNGLAIGGNMDFGPAFPISIPGYGDNGCDGMSLRDYFAAQIAAGMAAYSGTSGVSYGPDDIAGRAYQVADAMLHHRAGGTK